MTRRYIDSTEAAELLSVTPANLRQLVRRGRLQQVGKVDGRAWFDVREVMRLAWTRRDPSS